MDWVEVTGEPLELGRFVARVEDNEAGAIASFTGVTRNHFNGKRVLRLEYEAYRPMAEAALKGLCRAAREKWRLMKIAVAHREGIVAVGEASVVIVVSSVHRRDALEACAWLIDEIKASAPIWKKEVYEGGEVWKENSEFKERMHGKGASD